MRNLLILILFVLGLNIHEHAIAQGRPFYFNQWWEQCSKEYEVYYMEIEWGKAKSVKTYYSESKQPIRQAYFKEVTSSFRKLEFIDSTGLWTFWHMNGTKAAEWDFNSQPFRINNCWSPEGEQIVTEGNGYYKGYDEKGKLIYEGKLVDGLKEGDWSFYEEWEGKMFLSKKEHYLRSVPDGMSTEYYYNGNTRCTGWIVSGGRNGIWNWWKPGGEPLASHTFRRQDVDEYIELDLDSLPRPIDLYDLQRKIGYPSLCREAEIEGQITYRFLISETGEVLKRERIEEAHALLMKPVERYIDELKFKPGLLGSVPQEMWVNIPFEFKLLK